MRVLPKRPWCFSCLTGFALRTAWCGYSLLTAPVAVPGGRAALGQDCSVYVRRLFNGMQRVFPSSLWHPIRESSLRFLEALIEREAARLLQSWEADSPLGPMPTTPNDPGRQLWVEHFRCG